MSSTRKRMGAINKLRLKNLKYHLNQCTFALGLAGNFVQNAGAKEAPASEYLIPSNYIKMNIEISVDENTNIESIAKTYYVEELYPDFEYYCDMIKKENNIEYGVITPYQNIKVPVIVRNDDIYLNSIKTLETELETLPIWVDYIVQNGDTIESLAHLGAKDSTEAIECVDRICRYNDIDKKDVLKAGKTIYVINPKIGEIKKKIYSLEENLKSALVVNDEK